MTIAEVYNMRDVLDSGPIEGETLYNKAREYGRYDLCLFIAESRRNKALYEFTENIRLYEETSKQQYKDKATLRHYHRILWNEIIRRLKNSTFETLDATVLKETIIEELDLPKPYQNYCYACVTKCEVCPITDECEPCSFINSAYANFVSALSGRNIEEAIKQAERIRDAWIK